LVILASLRPASSLNQIRGNSGIPKPDSAKPDNALALDRIERSAVDEIGKASPFARKIAPFRLDRDIVEDQITFLATAVSCFRETWQNPAF
jgi:hypothetical protein